MLSIWLIPQDPELGKLRLLIKRIADITGGPVFEPHITILADIPLAPSEFANRSASHFRALPRLELAVGEIGTGTEYFKSLYLLTERSPLLNRIYDLASWQLPSKARGDEFEPHVSLAYGDQPYRKHPQLIQIANESIPLRLRFSGISIVRAGKLVPVGKWRRRSVVGFDH